MGIKLYIASNMITCVAVSKHIMLKICQGSAASVIYCFLNLSSNYGWQKTLTQDVPNAKCAVKHSLFWVWARQHLLTTWRRENMRPQPLVLTSSMSLWMLMVQRLPAIDRCTRFNKKQSPQSGDTVGIKSHEFTRLIQVIWVFLPLRSQTIRLQQVLPAVSDIVPLSAHLDLLCILRDSYEKCPNKRHMWCCLKKA